MKRRFCYLLILLIGGFYSKAQLTSAEIFLQYDSAWTYQNLRLIPFRFKQMGQMRMDQQNANASIQRQTNNVLSLQDAMQQHKIKIAEFYSNHGADVQVITVKNLSKQTIFIKEGDLLAGGKQDRMIAETKYLLPGKTEEFLNVFCVEPDRWEDKPKPFVFGGTADLTLRKTMHATGRQAEIWKQMGFEKNGNLEKGKKSSIAINYAPQKTNQATGFNYLQMNRQLSSVEKEYADYFIKRLGQSDSSYAGFLAVTDNRMIGCELFSDPAFTIISFQGMVHGFITQALLSGATPLMKREDIEAAIKPLIDTESSQKHFLEKQGKAFYHQQKLLHIMAYQF